MLIILVHLLIKSSETDNVGENKFKWLARDVSSHTKKDHISKVINSFHLPVACSKEYSRPV